MTTHRNLRRALFTTLAALVMFLAAGCEEPNEADLPKQIYVLKTNFTTRGTATDVDVQGNFAAVGEGTFGAVVLDVSDPLNVQRVFNYNAIGAVNCQQVALDVVNDLIAVFAPVDEFYGALAVFNFTQDSSTLSSYQTFLALSGPFGDFEAQATPDTMWIWGSDRTASDGFVAARVCFVPSRGKFDACSPGISQYLAPRGEMRGFAFRESDGVAAIALGQEGVHLRRARTSEPFATINTPAVAYDCAWYGDSIVVVADNFQVVIINAANLNAPQIIASLTIPNADRLQQVVVDGSYACVLDAFDGVYVVDVSNPRQPRYAQFLDGYDPTSLDAGPGGLYVTDEGYGLRIYARGPGF